MPVPGTVDGDGVRAVDRGGAVVPGVLLPLLRVVPELTDRCDRCAAAARLTVTLRTGGTLAFCGHHANRYADQLQPIAAEVETEEGFHWRGGGPPPPPRGPPPAPPPRHSPVPPGQPLGCRAAPFPAPPSHGATRSRPGLLPLEGAGGSGGDDADGLAGPGRGRQVGAAQPVQREPEPAQL